MDTDEMELDGVTSQECGRNLNWIYSHYPIKGSFDISEKVFYDEAITQLVRI